jgi:hypothetical protein
MILRQITFHIGDDVHDMTVALDDLALGQAHCAGLGDAADIIAAKIEQHQMLGALFGIGQ